jgi:sugar phosphate isomerase/epimerase
MTARPTDRRSFLKYTAVAAAAAGWWQARGNAQADQPAAKLKPLRLGGPVFGLRGDPKKFDPEELAAAHRKLGYRAAYCPAVTLDDKDRIRAITAAFAKHEVMLAEVGRWVNLLAADTTERAANIQKVTDGLALAEAVGARCCVDIAGSFNPQSWHGPHPDNLSPRFFDAIVENARKIVDAVNPKRARFCYEMMPWSLPDCPDAYLRLVKAVDRKGFGVHLDPCNILNSPTRFYHNTDVLNECFDKLGPWIVSCHAKDMAWANAADTQVHLIEVLPGTGSLDYTTYLKRLAALPADVPLMLEHLKTAEEYDKARQYIMETGGKAGVQFE